MNFAVLGLIWMTWFGNRHRGFDRADSLKAAILERFSFLPGGLAESLQHSLDNRGLVFHLLPKLRGKVGVV